MVAVPTVIYFTIIFNYISGEYSNMNWGFKNYLYLLFLPLIKITAVINTAYVSWTKIQKYGDA